MKKFLCGLVFSLLLNTAAYADSTPRWQVIEIECDYLLIKIVSSSGKRELLGVLCSQEGGGRGTITIVPGEREPIAADFSPAARSVMFRCARHLQIAALSREKPVPIAAVCRTGEGRSVLFYR